jgi:lipopolysaccharide transport system permease protein
MAVSESESVSPPRPMTADSTLSWRFDAVGAGYLSQLKELWQFRDMFPTLCVRANSLVYEKAFFGIGWMVVNTLAITLPFALVLSHYFKFDTSGVPASVFVLAAFSIWTLFRSCTQWMMKGLAANLSLMKNFNIPPLLLVAAMMANGIAAYAIVTLILAGAIVYEWIANGIFALVVGWNILLVVPVVVLTIALALGLSCFTSILSLIAADVNHVARYTFTALLFASPIFYPLSAIDEKYRFFFYFNPMTGVIEAYRWALFKAGNFNFAAVSLSVAITLLLLIAGTAFFLKLQRRILDFD